MRKKGSLQELQQLRMVAANMFDKAMAPVEIAQLLGVDDQTVRRWRRMYNAAGREALQLHNGAGRPVKMSDEHKQQFLEMLKLEPKAHGIDSYLWTTKLMARLIFDKFGISYHHDHVGVILHELGWSPQIPARRAKERDAVKIAEFRDKTWVELEKKAGPKEGRSSSPTKWAS
jgi:transposase